MHSRGDGQRTTSDLPESIAQQNLLQQKLSAVIDEVYSPIKNVKDDRYVNMDLSSNFGPCDKKFTTANDLKRIG